MVLLQDVGKEVASVLLFENISLAFSAIWANKMRSLLTMLGIIIGIASVIAINTVGNSLTSSFTDTMQEFGANNIMVQLQQKESEEENDGRGYTFRGPQHRKAIQKTDYMTDEMIDGLREEFSDQITGIEISASLGTGTVTVAGKTLNVSAEGYNSDYYVRKDLDMVAGSGIGDKAQSGGKNVAIIADYVVEKLFHNDVDEALGQTIEVVVGQKFYEFTIIGVYKYEANSIMAMAGADATTTLYLPIKTVQNKLHEYGYSGFTILTNATSTDETDAMMDDIEEYFDVFYHSNDNFAPTTLSMASMVSSFSSMLDKISLAISIVAGISLVVGGIGVMNIMLVSISERTREIGTRKALGATNGSIRTQFIVESMILCLIGGIIGILIGISSGSFAATKLGFAAAPSVSSIVTSVLFSIGIGVFFGYYPANKAAKMNPIDALRYE